jgi:hypothetical protein
MVHSKQGIASTEYIQGGLIWTCDIAMDVLIALDVMI